MKTETLTTEPRLTQHLKDVRRDAGKVAQDLKDHAQAKLLAAKKQATARFQDAREETTARFELAKTTARDAVDSMRGFIAEHPFAALGVWIGLGIFLAFRTRR